MKYSKYIIFFLLLALFFYGAFTIIAATFNPFKWSEETRVHFILYGFVANGILTIFYFINDKFKPSA